MALENKKGTEDSVEADQDDAIGEYGEEEEEGKTRKKMKRKTTRRKRNEEEEEEECEDGQGAVVMKIWRKKNIESDDNEYEGRGSQDEGSAQD